MIDYSYLKNIFLIFGVIYLIFSLVFREKLKILKNIYNNIYLYLDCILALLLIYICFKLRQYVAVIPLGLLVYVYIYNIPSDNYLNFSLNGLASATLLCVGTSLTKSGKLSLN